MASKPNKIDVAYAAGVLEGEGCFSFQHGNGRYPKIRMETTDLDVAKRVQTSLGCGSITSVKKRKSHWKQSYVLYIGRRDDVKRVLQEILPWMGARRRQKIKEMLDVL